MGDPYAALAARGPQPPTSHPLPSPNTPAEAAEAAAELTSALEFTPRLSHYSARWRPADSNDAHFFSVSAAVTSPRCQRSDGAHVLPGGLHAGLRTICFRFWPTACWLHVSFLRAFAYEAAGPGAGAQAYILCVRG